MPDQLLCRELGGGKRSFSPDEEAGKVLTHAQAGSEPMAGAIDAWGSRKTQYLEHGGGGSWSTVWPNLGGFMDKESRDKSQ